MPATSHSIYRGAGGALMTLISTRFYPIVTGMSQACKPPLPVHREAIRSARAIRLAQDDRWEGMTVLAATSVPVIRSLAWRNQANFHCPSERTRDSGS